MQVQLKLGYSNGSGGYYGFNPIGDSTNQFTWNI